MLTTPKPLRVYFHVYAQGDWVEPWGEFIAAVKESGLYDIMDVMRVGVVGLPSQRKAATELVQSHGDKIEIAVEADTGWEQVTLDLINSDSQEQDFYCLYGHTKGSAYRRPQNAWWRRDMIRHTVRRWAEAVELMDSGYDAIGIFWRTRPQLGKRSPVLDPHFSGNFWWSTSDYLKTLGPPNRNTRYDAEAWIGLNPRVKWFDISPGAPSQGPARPKFEGPINRSFLGGNTITVVVGSRVMGPAGTKLRPGSVVELDDCPYTQLLIKSGSVHVVPTPEKV